MSNHPVKFPRFIFTGPGPVKLTREDEVCTPRCRQAVISSNSYIQRQCKKTGSVLEGDNWFCHIHARFK